MRARPATISRSRSPRSCRACPSSAASAATAPMREGWGLYAEGLGKEMGFYREPISEFGMLSTQLWRAIRLVVDTGIHHHRWSRERAIDYFMDNGLLSRRDATKEVERYFNNPGQATSYMIGQLKILELRDRARAGARRALRHPRFPRGGARERRGAAGRARRAGRRLDRGERRLTRCGGSPASACRSRRHRPPKRSPAPTRPARVPARAKPISASPTTMPAKSSTSFARSGSESGASLAF